MCISSDTFLHTKLSPKKLLLVLWVYFAAIGLGNKLAGTIGQIRKTWRKNNFLGNNFDLFIDRLDSNTIS